MEEIIKIAAIAIISVVLTLIISDKIPFFAVFIVLATTVIILGMCFLQLEVVINDLVSLVLKSGISFDFFEPILKVCGIAIVVKISGDICKDAGFSAIAQKIQFAGSIISVVAVFPLFIQIIELLQAII